MTPLRFATRRTRRLFLLLGVVVVPPAVTLVGLAVAFAARERDSQAQRAHERQAAALQMAVHSIGQSLAEAERRVAEGPLQAGTIRLTVIRDRVVPEPDDALLWTVRRQVVDDTAGLFAGAEAAEYRGHADRAVAVYQRLSGSPTGAVRAGALLRLARVHRVARRWSEAIASYEQMRPLVGTFVDGAPADLQARRAICDVLGDAGRKPDQRDCAESLGADLVSGRWREVADRAIWEAAAADVAGWTGRGPAVDSAQLAFSEIAELLWRESALAKRSKATPSWRTVAVAGGVGHAYTDPEPGRALVVSPTGLASWVKRAQAAAGAVGAVSISGASGELLAGERATVGRAILRATPIETGLPWTVALLAAPPGAHEAAVPGQRRLLTIGLAAILLLLAGSSYFLWRTVSRELEVARLQTEFVAAVSHEFRTPLTSIRHISELLEESEILPADERRAFYASLTRNAHRLERFVESLLDFARLEANRRPYEMRAVDIGAFVHDVVADFSRDLAPRSFEIHCDVSPEALPVLADVTSLGHAIWNLLDNGVKYSPGTPAVLVSAAREGPLVRIAVTDHGIGIAASEQQEIFGRFVRGRSAHWLRVRGTGLGLAIVSHIVRAHRGTVEVRSEEGVGSTFTITLPAAEGGRDAVDQSHFVGSAGRA